MTYRLPRNRTASLLVVAALSLTATSVHAQTARLDPSEIEASDVGLDEVPRPPPARPAEDEIDGPSLFGIGLGMLAVGLTLDAVVLAVADDAVFSDTSSDGGFALALPPVLVAVGVQALAMGVASWLGADPSTAMRVGSVTSLVVATLLSVLAGVLATDPTAGIGHLDHENSAVYVGLHAGDLFFCGGLTFVVDEVSTE